MRNPVEFKTKKGDEEGITDKVHSSTACDFKEHLPSWCAKVVKSIALLSPAILTACLKMMRGFIPAGLFVIRNAFMPYTLCKWTSNPRTSPLRIRAMFLSLNLIGHMKSERRRPPETYDSHTTPQFSELKTANGMGITRKASARPFWWYISHLKQYDRMLAGKAMLWGGRGQVAMGSAMQKSPRTHYRLLSSLVSHNHKNRSDIAGVKDLNFYRGVDQDEAVSCTL